MSTTLVHGLPLALPYNDVLKRDQDLRDLLHKAFAEVSDEKVFATEALSGEQLTFGQLKSRSHVIAKNLQKSSRVGVSMRLSLELIVTLVGIVRRGLTFVALDPALPADRLRLIEEDSDVDCVVYGSDVTPLADPKSSWMSFTALLVAPSNDDEWELVNNESNESKSNSTFCILYTSGSAGRPKGVQISVTAAVNRLVWQLDNFPFADDDVPCVKTQIGFVDSIIELWAPLLKAKPLVIIPKNFLIDPEKLINAFNKFKITRITLVPSLLKVILDYIKTNKCVPKSLRFVFCSGEALTMDVVTIFFEMFRDRCSLVNYYGSTEVMADVTVETFKNLTDVRRKSADGRLSIGLPISNTTLILLDQDENGIGELVFAGKAVTDGYLDSVGDKKFVLSADIGLSPDLGRCFRTGDRGKLVTVNSTNGHQYTFATYYGRNDSQVKINGIRIDLSEIELLMRNKFELKSPVVLFDGTRILAFVSDEELNAAFVDRVVLDQNLQAAAVPEIVRVPKFPYLVLSGKIDRQQLLRNYREQKIELDLRNEIDWDTFIELDGENKRKFRILVEALAATKITGVHLDSNFFKVGGTSLNAVTVISKLRLAGYRISIDKFLGADTLREIVNKMLDSDSTLDSFEEMSLEPESERFICKGLRDKFTVVQTKDINPKSVSRLFALNFSTCEKFAIGSQYQNVSTVFESLFEYMKPEDISFGLVAPNSNHLVGFVGNVDNDDGFIEKLPMTFLTSSLLNFLETPVIERMQKAGVKKIMRGFMTLIDKQYFSESSDRIGVFLFLERKTIEMGIAKGYQGLITTNTSPLTQDLATEVLGYVVEHKIDNMGTFVDPRTGVMPWEGAPENYIVTVVVKYL